MENRIGQLPTAGLSSLDEASNVGGAWAANEIPETLLPDPASGMPLSGDTMAQIAALLVRSLSEDRSRSRDAAQVEECNIAHATADRIQQMHEAADDVRAAGWWAAAQGVFEGGGQLAGVCIGPPGQGEIDWAQGASSGGRIAGSLAGLQGNYYQVEQKGHEAASVEAQGHGEAAERRCRSDQDQANAAHDQLVRILGLLKEVEAAKNGAYSAAIMRG